MARCKLMQKNQENYQNVSTKRAKMQTVVEAKANQVLSIDARCGFKHFSRVA